jgi:flagellar protein FliS
MPPATCTHRDLIVEVYIGAEQAIAAAASAMREGRRGQATETVARAKHIFVGLLSTLDCAQGGAVAVRLRAMYAFFIGHLVEASLRQQPALLDELLPLVADLRQAWEAIPDDLVANIEGDRHA